MPSLTQFINANKSELAAKVRQLMSPLHDPSVDALHPGLKGLLRKPKGPQGHAITGAVKALGRQKDVEWCWEMGTGKSFCSIATAHLHADGKPYAALVVCPPHLTKKWAREIKRTVPLAYIVHISTWEQWMLLSRASRDKVQGPTWFITPISKAKLGADWKAAAILNKCSGLLVCPRCYRPVTNSKGDHVDAQWLSKARRQCANCGECLWQNCGKHKIEPSRIARTRMKGWFDYTILDEAHQLKSSDSLAASAMHDFISASSKVQLITGTLIAGNAEDLRPTYFRLAPHKFIERGFAWEDKGAFSEKYGKIQKSIFETQLPSGRKRTRYTVKKVVPGIMPSLYCDFVADRTMFLTLKEMGEEMPPYHELTLPSDMPKALADSYQEMCHVLITRFRELMQDRDKWMVARRFLSTISEAILTYPDDPTGWPVIGYKDEGQFVEVYQTKDMDIGILPKEKELIETLKTNRDAGLQSWVFSTRNATTSRLRSILSNEFKLGHLTTKVPTEKREDWIMTTGPLVDVMLSHPKLVETGLDLFGEGYNFVNLEWMSTGYELNVVRQASARAWRIGQTLPCTTRYHYYVGSAQEKVIRLMASKLQAAEFLEGSLEAGGLVDEAGESIEMQIINQLAATTLKAA